MDCSTIITVIVSALTPTIVAVANNIYQYKLNKQNNSFKFNLNNQNFENQFKMKELDLIHSEKVTAINNYIDDLVDYIDNNSDENLNKLKKTSSKVMLYVPKSAADEVSSVLRIIDDKESYKNDFKSALEFKLHFFLNHINSETSPSQ